MEDKLISFDTAKLAKEKGFDVNVLNCYNENGEVGDVENYFLMNFNQFPNVKGSNTNLYSATTQSLLQTWLRYKHDLHVEITAEAYRNGYNWNVQVKDLDFDNEEILNFKLFGKRTSGLYCGNADYKTYEEALEFGLQKALTLIR